MRFVPFKFFPLGDCLVCLLLGVFLKSVVSNKCKHISPFLVKSRLQTESDAYEPTLEGPGMRTRLKCPQLFLFFLNLIGILNIVVNKWNIVC